MVHPDVVEPTPPPAIPARIVNEHAYCPRLAYLMWVEGANADNAATIEGKHVHRRVDKPSGGRTADDRPETVRSLDLGDEALGVVARIDLVDLDGQQAIPVEYKRGSPWTADTPLRRPEQLQLYAQVCLLRRHSYDVPYAAVWFDTTRQRMRIEIPEDADEQVQRAVHEIRANAAAAQAPTPLIDDPKCPHCVLVGLCLPDEHARLTGSGVAPARLIAKDAASSPLYLTEPDTRLTKDSGRLVLKRRSETLRSARVIDVSHVIVFGNATVTSAAIRALTENGGSVSWCSFSGWPASFAAPVRKTDARRRIAQVRAHLVGRPDICQAMLIGKLRNQRTVLRRLAGDRAADDLTVLRHSISSMERATETATMLGIEGSGAKAYFSSFSAMLSDPLGPFDMHARNRRPPRDPVNALLSFSYALLARDATVAVMTAGLDPYVGLLHRPGFARPALALDLMEEFRPIIADSAVIRAINNGEVCADDFVTSRSACALTAGGRRRFISAYERRLTEEIRHPTFGYRVTYRRCLELQARFLAATLLGEIAAYRSFTTR